MKSFRLRLLFLLSFAANNGCLDSEDNPPPVENCGEYPPTPTISYREDDTGYHVSRSTFDALLKWKDDINDYASCVAWEAQQER